LWAGKEDTRGGSYAVAWAKVCQPKVLGGLGFHNLCFLNAALHARWVWFQKTDSSKPWSGMHFKVLPEALAIFNASVQISVGDSAGTLFWEDPWISGHGVDSLAREVLKLVKPRFRRLRTVQQGMENSSWVLDITDELSVDAVVQFLRLWTTMTEVPFHGGDDHFRWKWTEKGVYTSGSAYRAFFHGTTSLPEAAQVWHSFALFKVKFHAWLALRRRCWTADRLIRRGMQANPLCSLCGVSAKSLDHLSLQCPFTRQVWFGVAQRLGFSIPVPLATSTIPEWWPLVVEGLSRQDLKKANSLIMLTMRSLWLERNARVFDPWHHQRLGLSIASIASGRFGSRFHMGCARSRLRSFPMRVLPKGEE
jgi:hypothetical protein